MMFCQTFCNYSLFILEHMPELAELMYFYCCFSCLNHYVPFENTVYIRRPMMHMSSMWPTACICVQKTKDIF